MKDGIRYEENQYIITNTKDINIEKYIKPAETHKEDEKIHPLMYVKEDRKFITDEELEQIRLNKYSDLME